MPTFRMQVTDLFFVRDATIFAGNFESTLDTSWPAPAKLIIDGQDSQRITVQGPVHAGPKHFDLWTKDDVDVDRGTVISNEVWLVAE